MLFFSSLKIFLWRIYWRNTNLFQGHEMFVLHKILGTLEFIPVFLSMRILFVRMVWGRDLMFFSSKWWTNVCKKEDKQIGQDGTRTEGYIERCVCVCVCVCVVLPQSCLNIYNPVDCSPPSSCVRGSLQAGILEWVPIPFSRGSSQPRDWTRVSCIAGRFFTV